MFLQFARPAKGVHVLYVQGALHKQFDRDPRVSDRAGNRAGATDGRQLPGLLDTPTQRDVRG